MTSNNEQRNSLSELEYKRYLKRFAASFVVGYGGRMTLAIIGRLLRTRGRALGSLHSLFDESALVVREEAVRLGLTFGSFSALFAALRDIVPIIRRKIAQQLPAEHAKRAEEFEYDAFVAAALASLSVYWQHGDTRRWISLYVWPRLLQTLYRDAKQRNWLGIWSGPYRHFPYWGDVLLFMLGTGQVMWAYVLAPWSLPENYWRFIVHIGPMEEVQLATVRRWCTGRALPLAALTAFYNERGGPANHGMPLTLADPIPCSIFHPGHATCTQASMRTWYDAFRRGLPVYASVLALAQILQPQALLRDPPRAIFSYLKDTGRAALFLGSFNGLCQALVCATRRVLPFEISSAYWLMTALAGITVAIEKKSRRSELALYVLPRAVDSAWKVLKGNGYVRSVPHFSEMLLCAVVGVLVQYYERSRDVLPGIVRAALRLLIENRTLISL